MRALSVASIVGTFGTLANVRQNPKYRRIMIFFGMLYLFVYLLSLRHIVWLPETSLSGLSILAIEIADDWPAKLWKTIVPFSYEPVAAIYLGQRLGIFLALPNVLLGLFLGTLVGLNIALAIAHFNMHRSCRRPGVGLLGTLPSLLTGFTCCAPTVAIVLGGNSVLALIALRSYFVPASVLLLATGLLWGARRFPAGYQFSQ